MEWYGIIGILALLLILARLYRRSATACVWCAGKHPIARCRSFHAQRRWSVQSENDKGDTHRENQMPLVSPVRLQFTEKLRDHDYRTRFFAGQARDMIAM